MGLFQSLPFNRNTPHVHTWRMLHSPTSSSDVLYNNLSPTPPHKLIDLVIPSYRCTDTSCMLMMSICRLCKHISILEYEAKYGLTPEDFWYHVTAVRHNNISSLRSADNSHIQSSFDLLNVLSARNADVLGLSRSCSQLMLLRPSKTFSADVTENFTKNEIIESAYTCIFCQTVFESFPTSELYELHMNIHHKVNPDIDLRTPRTNAYFS